MDNNHGSRKDRNIGAEAMMDEPLDSNRRQFLKSSGFGALTLSTAQLGAVISGTFVDEVLAGQTRVKYESTDDLYRDIWQWDKVTWGTHTNACVPNGCSFPPPGLARAHSVSRTTSVVAAPESYCEG